MPDKHLGNDLEVLQRRYSLSSEFDGRAPRSKKKQVWASGGRMRQDLEALNGIRMRFTAKVERFGTKPAWNSPLPLRTILLSHVRRLDTGDEVADHLWFAKGAAWSGVGEGDHVEFDARVTTYIKGYQGSRVELMWDRPAPELDYRLERPTKVIRIRPIATMSSEPSPPCDP
jgi:hypothetical protein